MDGFDDPADAYYVADQMFNRERKSKLKAYDQYLSYCEGEEGYKQAKDWLEACWQLYTGNTDVYRETYDKLSKWMYEHGYRQPGYGSEY